MFVRFISLSRNFISNTESGLPVELRELAPDYETANARLAIECLRRLLADLPPADVFKEILPYCAKYFDAHIRRLTTVPEDLMLLLDRIILYEKHRPLQILTWRWPVTIGESVLREDYMFPDFVCIGIPQSVDSLFFLRCLKLDQVPAIRERYADLERIEIYPQSYLHIAAMTGLQDVVSELIIQGVDLNREDTSSLTVLQALCYDDRHEISKEVVVMLLEAGADLDKPTAGFKSPYEYAQEQRRVDYVQMMDEFRAKNSSETFLINEVSKNRIPQVV